MEERIGVALAVLYPVRQIELLRVIVGVIVGVGGVEGFSDRDFGLWNHGCRVPKRMSTFQIVQVHHPAFLVVVGIHVENDALRPVGEGHQVAYLGRRGECSFRQGELDHRTDLVQVSFVKGIMGGFLSQFPATVCTGIALVIEFSRGPIILRGDDSNPCIRIGQFSQGLIQFHAVGVHQPHFTGSGQIPSQ